MLSGAVFTSYLVAMMGAGTIVLVNLVSPGDHARADDDPRSASSRCSLARILYAVAFVLIRGITKVEA